MLEQRTIVLSQEHHICKGDCGRVQVRQKQPQADSTVSSVQRTPELEELEQCTKDEPIGEVMYLQP
jgi:hypothetical protein